jgi:heme-degrading monooxygenase HmoA
VVLANWATVHWVRYPTARTAASFALDARPHGCAAWKFGPDEAASRAVGRSASDLWCGIGLFEDLPSAERALEAPEAHMPSLGEASEAWHALLCPTAHHGEANLLASQHPGALFNVHAKDAGGAMFVITTAGFELRAKSDFARLIDFRRRVHGMRRVIAEAPGSLAHQVFAPQDPGDDAITMSLWRDEASMLQFAYRPGPHRIEVDRQKSEQTVDRSSFTRFRVLRSAGRWNGRNLP